MTRDAALDSYRTPLTVHHNSEVGMKPLPFAWPELLVFWLMFAWAIVAETRLTLRSWGASRRGDSADAGSLRFTLVGLTLVFPVAFRLAFVKSTQWPQGFQEVGFWTGLTLLLGGGLLRRHCWGMLGGDFTAHVRARPGQIVVDRGAYRWLRHPSYLAVILMFVGIGLALGNWASLLVLTVVTFVVLHYRILIEERALSATLGEPYRDFLRTRKRLIPFIY